MTGPAILLMALFIIVIWGGLVSAILMLAKTDDDSTGELGTAPGTDNESLLSVNASTTAS
ncbi:methionine/alanine import NSS transporter subunit MetS [Corynebacterium sp. YSMAA1_1_F7]|uniref:methionine/alanine import NSS transporter subunit MetS n=1 Tax=Corynebacterium sp. YSMAA1_1_F7 TaxID=3383590 RepID=UPI0038D0DC2C